jgi:hypothetical protein
MALILLSAIVRENEVVPLRRRAPAGVLPGHHGLGTFPAFLSADVRRWKDGHLSSQPET